MTKEPPKFKQMIGRACHVPPENNERRFVICDDCGEPAVPHPDSVKAWKDLYQNRPLPKVIIT